jgi:hypothetical protein
MEVLTTFLGIIVRLALPVGATALVGWLLIRLDSQWKSEAEQAHRMPVVCNSGCWEAKNCDPEKVKTCLAYQHQEMPCWQVFRGPDGCMKQACLACKVFRNAPIPVTS